MYQSFKVSEEKKKMLQIKKFTQRKSMKVIFFPIVLKAIFNRINCQSQKNRSNIAR
jgi:hypothetical protein